MLLRFDISSDLLKILWLIINWRKFIAVVIIGGSGGGSAQLGAYLRLSQTVILVAQRGARRCQTESFYQSVGVAARISRCKYLPVFTTTHKILHRFVVLNSDVDHLMETDLIILQFANLNLSLLF